MIRIKVIGAIGNKFCHAKALAFGGRYEFTFDPNASQYDWLVVYSDIPRRGDGTYAAGYEPLACPRAHTILTTNEPVSIKYYGRVNCLQYGYMLTNRPFEPERHPGYVFGRGYYSWQTGRTWQEEQAFAVPPKTRTISVICSAKMPRQANFRARRRLVEDLVRRMPELEWYGWGVRRLDHQYEAMDEYRYTVAVENHIAPGHWTEKIADAILSECLAFYAGDPDLGKILPPDSFVPIPVDDPEAAYRIIRKAIDGKEYEKRLPAIREAKRLLLTKYNFCHQVIALIESGKPSAHESPDVGPQRIYERHVLRRRDMRALLSDVWHHIRIGK